MNAVLVAVKELVEEFCLYSTTKYNMLFFSYFLSECRIKSSTSTVFTATSATTKRAVLPTYH